MIIMIITGMIRIITITGIGITGIRTFVIRIIGIVTLTQPNTANDAERPGTAGPRPQGFGGEPGVFGRLPGQGLGDRRGEPSAVIDLVCFVEIFSRLAEEK